MIKILIIEDEKLIRNYLKKAISKKVNTSIESCGNGIESLELLKNNKFNLIFCDVMLDDITGFDIFEEVRSQQLIHSPQENFIFITAYTSPEILNKINLLKCRLIKKPFSTINEFLDIINEHESLP